MNPEKEQKVSHDGHRQRCKTRVLTDGCRKMTDIDLLEMLLFYAVPRIDTRKQAEELINKFGSIEGVINAESDELTKLVGLKENVKVYFELLHETVSRVSVRENDTTFLEGDNLKKYLIDLYKNVTAETVYALYFGTDGSFLGKQLVFRGGVSSARFSLRTITEGVIRIGGKSVILAHNHPSNVLVPSGDDIISTKRIAAHLTANDINLLEHYIVGKDDCVGIFELE